MLHQLQEVMQKAIILVAVASVLEAVASVLEVAEVSLAEALAEVSDKDYLSFIPQGGLIFLKRIDPPYVFIKFASYNNRKLLRIRHN